MIERLRRNVARARSGLRRGRYDRGFFAEQDEGARRSAEVVVPLILELVEPRSVVDVGCGSGAWLAAFAQRGVRDLVGVDGEAVPAELLRIPSSALVKTDLADPLTLDRTFDLALCLEVAEHIPRESAETLIASLTALSPFVLFSAAIPHQGGMRHVNEQWQDHWGATFRPHGYVPVDCLRRKVWNDPAVSWWYAQNVLLFAEEAALASKPKLQAELEHMGTSQLSLVHPRCYESRRRAVRQILGVPWGR